MKEHYKAIKWPFHTLIPSGVRKSGKATWNRNYILAWLKTYPHDIILYQPSIDAEIKVYAPEFARTVERFKYPMRVRKSKRVVYFQIGKAPLEILVWDVPDNLPIA